MNEPRATLLHTYRAMQDAGLNAGASGNVSVRGGGRSGQRFLVTPSGRPPAACDESSLVEVDFDGHFEGPLEPSSEWRLHRDIYAHFPDAQAVLHAHSPFATALSCHRRGIPPFHYMIARFGGGDIRCAQYALFGSQALSDAVVAALQGRSGCLMASHGMVVHGRDLAQGLAQAIELETLCAQYWRACQLGPPVLMTDAEVSEALQRFRSYGPYPTGR